MFPPDSTPVTLVNPPHAFELEFFHPHHHDLPPGHPRVTILPTMKEIPLTSPCPTCLLPRTSASWVLGLANQVVPHTGSWRPLATAVNYLVRIAPIVYMAFQAWLSSPVGVQPDSVMGCDTQVQLLNSKEKVIH
ncbi:hypothetical protein DSO57_1004789 [Entomophthora muscae]|uniref:Uncharacterized protein n=1 Tax=Entomophthora muscae TaxID=34485 RepID=A0ACC2UUC5_9FUNG|nr:hypothetical protein DSO57_1004789 [Entomophthora muscae]